MRQLIHYVGDAHQPLHGEVRIDHEFPAGDKGCNDFPVPNHYDAANLHAVWDSAVYEFHTNPKLPFSDADWDLWGAMADALVAKHPVNTLNDVNNLNPHVWA